MLAILEDTRTGQISVLEVPPPELRSRGILVQTSYSAISSGTERATIATGEKSLVAKAMARPDLVRQVLDFARQNGLKAAYQKVQSRLEKFTALGYSCSGIVLAAGAEVQEFRPGDRVACAGAGYATHAEINFIPRNLAVKVPDNVSLKAASLTTIGAIAIQGVRQAQVAFGETVVVVGTGLIGMLTVGIAKGAGCRVIAMDIDEGRAELALAMGAHYALSSSNPRVADLVKQFSGYGADAAIVTATSDSSAPVETAASVLRDRGRISVVGNVGLGVPRAVMYAKELSLTLSRSYGPGRYDPHYEEEGVDYPIGYVRWTEQRNMEAFLGMLASGALSVEPLTQNLCPASDGQRAFADILTSRSFTSILEYPVRSAEQESRDRASVRRVQPKPSGRLGVGCIGAGSFARDVIFPLLRSSSIVELRSVATNSGSSAESARRNFGFQECKTSSELLQDPQGDAVFVLSQHDSHARYVVEALRSGKHVFVEKPLAVSREELRMVVEMYNSLPGSSRPLVMVGFNRRFAPFTDKIRDFFARRREPMLLHIRVNAGYIPREHWSQTRGTGGRIVGELCHFIDWARAVVQAPITKVAAAALPDGSRYNLDNVTAIVHFADGSLANVIYAANGDPSVPKEFFEVLSENSMARLTDFVELELIRNRKKVRLRSQRNKGHEKEIALTIDAMMKNTGAPIPFEELLEVTETTFAVHDSIATGLPIDIVGGSVLSNRPAPLEATVPLSE